MEIIVAKHSGLCYGVKRALRIARRTRRKENRDVHTFGEIIHNPQVIAELKAQNIYPVEDINSLRSGTVIIRSHGVSPDIYELLDDRKIEVVDATCPIVKKIQNLVSRLAKKEEEIIIVGNREHPEIKGHIGYSLGKGVIVENEAEVESMLFKKRRSVLAQSTQDHYLLGKVVAALIQKTEELKVYNTICNSTQTRQRDTSELASIVDTLFIVGGKNSSNTKKLYQISKRILPHTYFIESAEQITPQMLKGAKKIGLSGGASTPPEAIQEAVSKIKKSIAHRISREHMIQ